MKSPLHHVVEISYNDERRRALMKEKKTVILEGAMELFSKKGFNQTSMQEIADHLGIAKGSIYHYFKSKDQLLLEIIWHYYDVISAKMDAIERDDVLSARQKFFEQLRLSISVFVENREFILVNMKETFQFKDEIERIFRQMRQEIFHWLEKKFLEVYGEETKPYVYDLVASLNGFVHEYISLIILDKIEVDLTRLTHHLLLQCDVLVEGFKQNKNPLLRKEMFSHMTSKRHELDSQIEQLEEKAQALELNEIVELCDALKKQAKPHTGIMTKSMLYYLKHLGEKTELAHDIQKLMDIYHRTEIE